MQFARKIGAVALATSGVLFLLGAPVQAQQQPSVSAAAEELGNRTKTNGASQSSSGGLSDSAVRVMATFALSILPDEVQDKSGKKIKLDKSNPNTYLIPLEEARRIIRVATRSAYAEACDLTELGQANYEAMYRSEIARKVWSGEQIMFIKALHTFATSYFAGNAKITAEPGDGQAPNGAQGTAATISPKKLECAPGQKEKVTSAIVNYVQSTGVNVNADNQSAPAPASPATTSPQAASPDGAMPELMRPAGAAN
jgi:hypothetical protein